MLIMATAYALKQMILIVEDRGELGDEIPKSLVGNTLVPFIAGKLIFIKLNEDNDEF